MRFPENFTIPEPLKQLSCNFFEVYLDIALQQMANQNHVNDCEGGNRDCAEQIEDDHAGGNTVAVEDFWFVVGDPINQHNKGLHKKRKKENNIIEKHLEDVALLFWLSLPHRGGCGYIFGFILMFFCSAIHYFLAIHQIVFFFYLFIGVAESIFK